MLNKIYFLSIPLLLLALFSCKNQKSPSTNENFSDPFSHIKDSAAVAILSKAVETAGGLDRWHAKKSISFSKSYQLLFEDGTIEQEANQHHHYMNSPHPQVEISWESGEDKHAILFSDSKVQKVVNNMVDSSANEQSLMNTVLSSTFVANLPFKIISDEGAEISYNGKDTLENNKIVECIQVKYYPDQFENHSSEDEWNLYFDESTYYLIGYMVKHDDHISFVKNTQDTIIDGFYFVLDRESYRVTDTREPLYLRAVYHYDDYKIQF